MKRSLSTVCTAALLACLAAALGGCAVDGEATDAPTLGESRQDLSLGEASAPQAIADESAEEPGGERPQPQPWNGSTSTGTGTVPGAGPAPDSDPRRLTSDSSVGPGGERPQPQPWYESAGSVNLKTNKQ